jgi:hypothetical protein
MLDEKYISKDPYSVIHPDFPGPVIFWIRVLRKFYKDLSDLPALKNRVMMEIENEKKKKRHPCGDRASALQYAVRQSSGEDYPDIEVVQALLKKGYDPNMRDYTGYTPMHDAVESVLMGSDFTILDLLIEFGGRMRPERIPSREERWVEVTGGYEPLPNDFREYNYSRKGGRYVHEDSCSSFVGDDYESCDNDYCDCYFPYEYDMSRYHNYVKLAQPDWLSRKHREEYSYIQWGRYGKEFIPTPQKLLELGDR